MTAGLIFCRNLSTYGPRRKYTAFKDSPTGMRVTHEKTS